MGRGGTRPYHVTLGKDDFHVVPKLALFFEKVWDAVEVPAAPANVLTVTFQNLRADWSARYHRGHATTKTRMDGSGFIFLFGRNGAGL